MYTGIKPFLVCDPAKQPIKLLPFVDIESGANGIIMFARYAPDLSSCVPAGCREVQRVGPPVCNILATFDQASFLEFIQECNELAGQDRQLAAKLLLAEPRGHADQPENTRVRTRQAQVFQPLAKLASSVCSYLRQQERGVSSKFRLCMRFGPVRPGHSCII